MRTALARFRAVYGSHPLHLLTLVAGFALFGYVLATIKPTTLWNPNTWWQSIIVWFAAAIIAHDLVLFPDLRAGRPDPARRQSHSADRRDRRSRC